MPAFGADGLLEPAQIADVTQYVLSLTKRQTDEAAAVERRADLRRELRRLPRRAGRAALVDLGGPALNDAIWLYGGEPEQIAAQINRPRLGVMPPWQGRLDDADDQDAGGLRPQPGRRRVALPARAPLPAPAAAAIETASSPASERSAAW